MPGLKEIAKLFSSRHQTLHLEYKTDFKPRYGYGLPAHDLLYSIIDENREAYQKLLTKFISHKSVFRSIKKESKSEDDAHRPYYFNEFLPALDMLGLYGLLTELNPKRYIEIGSGNSTKVAYLAKNNHKLQTKITSIDPYPRAEIKDLVDQVYETKFEETNFDFLFDLEENDIVFVDNSHRVFPNSDATVFFMDVLPKLKKGVIVQIHDIYLPYDYPQDMCNRAYSEQYMLAAFIMANPERYYTLLPNIFISRDEKLQSFMNKNMWDDPYFNDVQTHGGSYWLQIH